MRKSELIIHPVRFRILRELAQGQLTTQELDNRLPDVATSSLYRHLKLLLKGGVVSVAETRLVNGIQEKVYQLEQPPVLGAEDMAGLTADEHVGYFATFVLTLLHDYAAYVEAAMAGGGVDMLADRVGYREVTLYGTLAEMDAAFGAMNEALLPLVMQGPGNGRSAYKLATVLHPRVGGDG